MRSNADADPFLRALNVAGIPRRFSGQPGLYAREEVRLLVGVPAGARGPRRLGALFYLAASELYRLGGEDLTPSEPLRRAQPAAVRGRSTS